MKMNLLTASPAEWAAYLNRKIDQKSGTADERRVLAKVIDRIRRKNLRPVYGSYAFDMNKPEDVVEFQYILSTYHRPGQRNVDRIDPKIADILEKSLENP